MKQYSADNVSIIVDGTPITGFADGAFADIARAVESATLFVGADGEATVVYNPNKSGSIVVRLAQTSPSNAVLSLLEATRTVFAVIVKDTNGNGRITSKQISAIFAISRDRGMSNGDVRALAKEMHGKMVDYLTKQEASQLIEHLLDR